MNRHDAGQILNSFLKPIFGFALKNCRNIQDAEDLSQEIAIKAFRALTVRDDIADAGKFIWAVAHNSLSNYYRDSAKNAIGIPLDEVAEVLADDSADPADAVGSSDEIVRLQSEIAYLSKLQRKIVIAYYFENKKQSEIARDLGIPLGTIKWHLFEAKKELKRGMDTMRKASELKFNPIRFHSFGINGSSGTKSPDEFFRSALAQNICYSVRREYKTVNEIADELGVSPVYVENEVEFLEEYGLLLTKSGKFIANFIIDEPNAGILTMQDSMYKRAAAIFANELFDELTGSGLVDDPDIWCGQTDEPITLTGGTKRDRNFILWSLIPYIAARSGEQLMDNKISFEEVMTIRPDGGRNIVNASVVPDNISLPDDYVYMNNWCGPMWNGNGEEIFWQIDSEWSERPSPRERNITDEAEKVITFYHFEEDNALSKYDYAWLAERGYIKTVGDPDGMFKSSWQIVIISGKEINDRLLGIGERIKARHKAEFDEIKKPYVKAELDSVPPHLRRVREYEQQFIFHSDGWFLLHCIKALLANGKLKPPTEGQRKSLMTIIAPESSKN